MQARRSIPTPFTIRIFYHHNNLVQGGILLLILDGAGASNHSPMQTAGKSRRAGRGFASSRLHSIKS